MKYGKDRTVRQTAPDFIRATGLRQCPTGARSVRLKLVANQEKILKKR